MASRLETVQEYVNGLVKGLPEHDVCMAAKGHLCGVSASCALLALHRGLNAELAAVSGLLHDVYRFKTGISEHHAHNGAEMARVVLKRLGGCFDDAEKRTILSAIFHHSDKVGVHGPYDEVLKDADILDPFLYEAGRLSDSGARRHRLERMISELGLTAQIAPILSENKLPRSDNNINKRLRMAEEAERLAGSHIVGSRQDAAYMNLIRYWPEDSAFDELKNGWCAAFVYHCCQEAGFVLPIRWPTESLRFACVAPWNTWSKELGFFIDNEPGFVPQRGDIVLYRNSIPPANKPPEQRNIPIDHIGIVLFGNADSLTVAEGNVNNKNVSGILTRPLHENIEGFIRIGDAFDYDDWKFDLNTERITKAWRVSDG